MSVSLARSPLVLVIIHYIQSHAIRWHYIDIYRMTSGKNPPIRCIPDAFTHMHAWHVHVLHTASRARRKMPDDGIISSVAITFIETTGGVGIRERHGKGTSGEQVVVNREASRAAARVPFWPGVVDDAVRPGIDTACVRCKSNREPH